jgi:DNA modification methylase
MPKINLEENDLVRLFEAADDGYEPPEDLIGKLFPSFVEKLRQEGKFDAEALIRHKIPTIEYAGKRPEGVILASATLLGQSAPLQAIRSFGEPGEDGWQNMIVQGDNLQFLKTASLNQDPLIKDKVKGKVKLIYIDPPFGTGDEYGGSNGELSYSAKQKGAEFIENFRERLIFLREILAKDGIIFVRIDYHFGHYIKIILDEIYGKESFQNEFIVNRIRKNVTFQGRRSIPVATDSVFLYFQSAEAQLVSVEKPLTKKRDGYWHALDSSGIRYPRERTFWGKVMLPPDGRHWTFTQDRIDEKIRDRKIRLNPMTGKPEYWIEPKDTITLDTNWTDISGYTFSTGYPTENSETLLERVIRIGTRPGDLIIDVFAGSGTTEKLGRRWIMCDFGKHAIYTMQKRMLEIDESKVLDGQKKNAKYSKPPKPFSVVSVGAYDFTRVMNLRKNKDAYISFVLSLFGIPKEEKDFASKYRLDSVYGEKDGDPVEIFPVWDDDYLYNVKVDEDYLKEIIIQSRGRIKGNFYIIVPETCTVISDTTLPNNQGDDIYFKLLKFPYKILEEVARNFAIEEQPDSAQNINNLISSVGFYFNDEVTIEVKKNGNGFKLTGFKTMIVDRNGKIYEGLDGLSLVLIDLNYNGKVFKLDKAVYAKEIKDGEISIEGISGESAIIVIDKHGNESKPTYIAG